MNTGDTGIIGTGDRDTFEHGVYRLCLTSFQENLGTTHAGGIFRDGYSIVQ